MVSIYDLTMISIRHSTAITLHNPYVDFSDSQSTSASRCVHSARAILTAYYRLYETSLDITRLHPLVVVGIRPYLLFCLTHIPSPRSAGIWPPSCKSNCASTSSKLVTSRGRRPSGVRSTFYGRHQSSHLLVGIKRTDGISCLPIDRP